MGLTIVSASEVLLGGEVKETFLGGGAPEEVLIDFGEEKLKDLLAEQVDCEASVLCVRPILRLYHPYLLFLNTMYF